MKLYIDEMWFNLNAYYKLNGFFESEWLRIALVYFQVPEDIVD